MTHHPDDLIFLKNGAMKALQLEYLIKDWLPYSRHRSRIQNP